MQNKDDFDDPRQPGVATSLFQVLDLKGRFKARGPLYTVLPVVAMIAIVAGVLWYSYPREAEKREIESVPIIRADASAWRVAPQDPGGMDIPWKDSTVFETLRASNDAQGPVENLLPAAEEPLERDQIFAGLKTALESQIDPATVAAKPVETAPAPVAEKPEAVAATPVVEEDITEKVAAAEPVPAAQAATPEPVKTEPEAEQAAKTEPASGGTEAQEFYIQLGSVRNREDAEKSWSGFKTSFPGKLDGLTLRVQEADLGERGMFYRIQGGPVEETRARAICQTVEEKKPGGCLVVRQ